MVSESLKSHSKEQKPSQLLSMSPEHGFSETRAARDSVTQPALSPQPQHHGSIATSNEETEVKFNHCLASQGCWHRNSAWLWEGMAFPPTQPYGTRQPLPWPSKHFPFSQLVSTHSDNLSSIARRWHETAKGDAEPCPAAGFTGHCWGKVSNGAAIIPWVRARKVCSEMPPFTCQALAEQGAHKLGSACRRAPQSAEQQFTSDTPERCCWDQGTPGRLMQCKVLSSVHINHAGLVPVLYKAPLCSYLWQISICC